MDTRKNTVKEEEEEEFLKHRSDQDNKSTYAMVLDAPNPEEAGNEDGPEVYEKVWGAVASQIFITMPQTFRLGAFLEYLRLIQERAVYCLQKLCANVALDRTWADKGLHTTNIFVSGLETQGLGNLPGWWEKLRMALDVVGWTEAVARDI